MGSPLADTARTCGLGYIMQRFGQAHRDQRWQRAYVEALIAREGFPAPLPLLSGANLVTAVKPRSQWDRLAVDQWFADRLPPETAAAEEHQQRRHADNDMDAAANTIALVMAGRRIAFGARA